MRPAHDKLQAHSYCYRNTHKNAITLEILPKAVTENDITVLTKGSIFMRAYTAREAPPVTVRAGWYEDSYNITGENGERNVYGHEYQQAVASYTGRGTVVTIVPETFIAGKFYCNCYLKRRIVKSKCILCSLELIR